MNSKEKVKSTLDGLISSLQDVSDWMYENPELGFEEYKTSEYLINYIILSIVIYFIKII